MSVTVNIPNEGDGVYRIPVSDYVLLNQNTKYITVQLFVDGQATSELKTIEVNQKCTNQDIYLSWLNTLGNWEYWQFTAPKEYGVDITGSAQVRRNIYNNWDDGFINGETQDDFIRVEAYDVMVVRSQYLTHQQLNAIRQIIYSIKVQQIRDDGTKITVLIDKDSFTYRKDRQKLYTVDFGFRYSNEIQIQTQ